MNLHGLKLNRKTVASLSRRELAKPLKEQSEGKIRNFRRDKSNLNSKINKLRAEKKDGKRQFRKVKKPGQTSKDHKPLPAWCKG